METIQYLLSILIVFELLPHSKEGPGFESILQEPFCVDFACFPLVCVGSLQIFWLSPAAQRHAKVEGSHSACYHLVLGCTDILINRYCQMIPPFSATGLLISARQCQITFSTYNSSMSVWWKTSSLSWPACSADPSPTVIIWCIMKQKDMTQTCPRTVEKLK